MTEDGIKTLLVCIVLAVTMLVAFAGVRNNDFVNYDDDSYITENPQVQNGLNLKSITWALTTIHAGYWHPLTWLSHIIDCSLFGLKPAGHHLVNVGFHIANVILLFLILKVMTGAIWPSAFVAGVFGLHPVAVESVAWVAERKNVLSTFFALLTIWAYWRWTLTRSAAEGPFRKPGVRRYLIIMFFFAAGLLSKPMVVTLPFVLILLDFWPLNRIFGSQSEIRNPQSEIFKSIYEKLPLFFMSAALCVFTYIAQSKLEATADLTLLPLVQRFDNALISYVKYLGKIFYPVSLGVLYPLSLTRPPLWQSAGSLVLLVVVTVAIIIAGRRRRFLLTGWFWFLGTLVPVIGLVQVGLQSMADRYLYWPGIGIYIIVAWLAGDLSRKVKLAKPVLSAAGVLILAVCLIMTRTQVQYWKSSAALYLHTLEVTEDNFFIYTNYGVLLRKAGRTDEAIRYLRRAIEINYVNARAHTNLGIALEDKGLSAEASAEFKRSLEINPNDAMTQNYYGISLVEQDLYDKAVEHFIKALRNDEHFSGVLRNLCNAGLKAGKTSEVLEVIKTWQNKMPDNPDLRYWEQQLARQNMLLPEQGIK
jgi:Tfp pilus assembly protein PilF